MSDETVQWGVNKRVALESALSYLIVFGRVKMRADKAVRVLEDYESHGFKYAAERAGVTEATVTRLVCLVREHLGGDQGRDLVPPSADKKDTATHIPTEYTPSTETHHLTGNLDGDAVDDPWAVIEAVSAAFDDDAVDTLPVELPRAVPDPFSDNTLRAVEAAEFPAPYASRVPSVPGPFAEVDAPLPTSMPSPYAVFDDDDDDVPPIPVPPTTMYDAAEDDDYTDYLEVVDVHNITQAPAGLSVLLCRSGRQNLDYVAAHATYDNVVIAPVVAFACVKYANSTRSTTAVVPLILADSTGRLFTPHPSAHAYPPKNTIMGYVVSGGGWARIDTHAKNLFPISGLPLELRERMCSTSVPAEFTNGYIP